MTRSLCVIICLVIAAAPMAFAQRGSDNRGRVRGDNNNPPARSWRTVPPAPAPRAQAAPRTQATPRYSAPNRINNGRDNVRQSRPNYYDNGRQRQNRSGVFYGSGNHIARPQGRMMWWNGGNYYGTWYNPGWYRPRVIVYSQPQWYWNGWGWYQYNSSPLLGGATGVKFDLDAIPKNERDAAKKAAVYIPDQNGKLNYLGTVGNFSSLPWRVLPLDPGTYDLTVVLPDGRDMTLTVAVQPQRATKILLRFDQPMDPQADRQQLIPADPSDPADQDSPQAPQDQ